MKLPAKLEHRHALLLVLAGAMLAYATSLFGTFVYDDLHSVRDNPAIRSLANIPAYFTDVTMFSSLKNDMYRPVLLITYALDHAVAGLQAWIYKLTNVLLHAASAGLLFSIARVRGAAVVPAMVGAMVFAVHPLASEAVNMVSGRSDLLMILGVLLGIRCHMAAMEGNKVAVAGTFGAAFLACGSKATGVVLPACLVVLEGMRAQRSGWSLRAAMARLLPATALSVGYLFVRRGLFGAATATLPAMTGGPDVMVGGGRDLITHWATMCLLLPRTLVQAVIPARLSLDPQVHFAREVADPYVICGALFLLLITWFGIRAPRRRPLCFLGTMVAWVTSLPWILLPLNIPLSEHRLYGILAGLSLVLAGVLPAAGWRARSRAAAAIAAIAVFAMLAGARSLDYRDERYLWEKVLAHHPQSVHGICGMALVYLREDRLLEARDLLRRAVGIYPGHIAARRNLAETNLMLGERGEPFTALVMADYLVDKAPSNPFHRLLLCRASIAVGDLTGDPRYFDAAEKAALSCLEIAEPKGLVYRMAAFARYKSGDLSGAIMLLDDSVTRGLDHLTVLLHRSELLAEAGRQEEANADLRAAMAQDPLNPMVQAAMQRRFNAGPGR